MKRQLFNTLIQNASFSELFISELGWNNPAPPEQLPPVEVDGTVYYARVIAERSGYKVLSCEVDAIPALSVCRRIDLKVRNYANDYILIFVERNAFHHLWVAPVRKVDKRDIVTTEYTTLDQAEFLHQKADALAFGFAEQTTIVDVRERVYASFIVNSEKITKDFYAGFKKEHKAFVDFIQGITGTDTVERDRQWYASVMLNRLMFCYFIQKKGFLDGDVDYLHNKLEQVKRLRGENRFFRSFYLGFLRRLFHDGLNSPGHSEEFEHEYGRIPYLNGGMFDEHPVERDYAGLDIADEAFERLFGFFDRWNWHLDTRITASGKDINPDVLGYIFEQYINDRAQMGAYYTKEDITEYIGRNCILPCLFDKIRKATGESARDFEAGGFVWKFLQDSGDRYIFDAVKKGADHFSDMPANIAAGIDAAAPGLLERRKDWNTRTPEKWGLPTEIWRETVERLQRYNDIVGKIKAGAITSINDFITYNLDIRNFTRDILAAADSKFIRNFYHALRRITILDPTCGSGAFLFAALNILEPLYEICIDRMRDFNRENPLLFKEELGEIAHKYRSNIQYFIYKSIILRNLYGVDIMVEAAEIAKLRLFLKMVAVVDVDFRAGNMGLDPLPDIDFNIRCGNTLVGYANEAELERDLVEGDMFANEEFKEKIRTEMKKVAAAFETFKDIQLRQAEDMLAFKEAKANLQERLARLDECLDHRLFMATQTDNRKKEDTENEDIFDSRQYRDWLSSHQPFHWLAEFYQIIQGNGGFDVIIGNPPYVPKNKITYLSNETFKCSDLYGYVIKRILQILCSVGNHGFIVMHNLGFSRNFSEVRNLLNEHNGSQWYSFYSRIPSGLFSGDVRVRNCIYLLSSQGNKRYTSRLHRWFAEQRETLFSSSIQYNSFMYSGVVPMLDSELIQPIYENKKGQSIATLEDNLNGKELYYKKVGYNFLSVSNIIPSAFDLNEEIVAQSELDSIKIQRDYYEFVQLLSCGKLYLTKWLTYGDDFHLTNKDIVSFTFPFNAISIDDKEMLHNLYDEFSKKLPATIQYKLNAGIKVGTFNTSALWSITDRSDMIFLSYLSDNPLEVHETIENHIAKCVISEKI